METRKVLKVTFKDGTYIHFPSLSDEVVSCELIEIPAPSELFSDKPIEEKA